MAILGLGISFFHVCSMLHDLPVRVKNPKHRLMCFYDNNFTKV